MEIKASPANGKIPTSPSAQTPVGFDMSWENPKFNEEREVTYFLMILHVWRNSWGVVPAM